MYCRNCGHQVDDNAVICTQCGCLTDLGERMNLSAKSQTPVNLNGECENTTSNVKKESDTLGLVAKIFMILSTVITGFYIIPLAWMLPMTIVLCNKLKNDKEITVGFAVCILLFCNTIAGILLLCRRENKKM